MPGRAGQHTGADVGHPGEFEQALDGAVLAVRAVQDGNTTSTEARISPAPPAASDTSSPRRRGSADSASAVPDAPLTSGSRPSVIARRLRGRVGEHPRPVRGDADRDHLEALRVEVAQDAARRHAGNGVLAAAAAEDDGDADTGWSGQSQPREATGAGHARPGSAERSISATQVVGVLDARRDPGEPVADLVTPAGPAVHRGVDAAEAGRGHQQLAAAAPVRGRRPRRRVRPTPARRTGASAPSRPRAPGHRADPGSAPTAPPGGARSMVASASALWHCRSKRRPALPRLRSSSHASKAPRIGPASSRSRASGGHQFGVAARDVAGEQVAVAGQRLGRAGHHQVGAQRQRLLPQRRGGGVVDDQPGAPAAADQRQPVQVDDVESGVGRRFGEHHVGVVGRLAHLVAARLDAP